MSTFLVLVLFNLLWVVYYTWRLSVDDVSSRGERFFNATLVAVNAMAVGANIIKFL